MLLNSEVYNVYSVVQHMSKTLFMREIVEKPLETITIKDEDKERNLLCVCNNYFRETSLKTIPKFELISDVF